MYNGATQTITTITATTKIHIPYLKSNFLFLICSTNKKIAYPIPTSTNGTELRYPNKQIIIPSAKTREFL